MPRHVLRLAVDPSYLADNASTRLHNPHSSGDSSSAPCNDTRAENCLRRIAVLDSSGSVSLVHLPASWLWPGVAQLSELPEPGNLPPESR